VAITIKKKKIELKSDTSAPAAGSDDVAAVAPEEAVVAAVMRRDVAPARKSGGSFVPFVIMGLLACAFLGALIAMQVAENSSYKGAVPQHGATAPR